MTIYKTAYDTIGTSGFRIKEVQEKLRGAMISGSVRAVEVKVSEDDASFPIYLLEGGNSQADAIPYFNHPLHVPTGGKTDDGTAMKVFAVDVRNFGKWYAPNQEFVVRNRPEYDWNIKRAILNQVWLDRRPEVMRDISTIPCATYAALMGQSIARRFALDAAEQMNITVIAAYFYLGLFQDGGKLEEFEFNKMVSLIARTTHVPADKIFHLLENLPLLSGLEAFCEACKTVTGSVALTDLNVGTLVAITGGTWYGTNSRENLVVGLEHVPTWLLCVQASLDEATFKRSVLAKISMSFDKANAGAAFTKSMNVLLGGADVITAQVNKTE